RQADERGRILAFHFRDQCDAEALGLGAGGAVVGLLLREIALDRPVVELAKADAARDDADLRVAVASVVHAGRRMKQRLASGQRPELAGRVRVSEGFPEEFAVARSDLVATDD